MTANISFCESSLSQQAKRRRAEPASLSIHAGSAFNLEKWSVSAKADVCGATITVFRILPGRFTYNSELMNRMSELQVNWKEVVIAPEISEDVNAFVGTPEISAEWKRLIESEGLPDLVWEEGGRLTEDDTRDIDIVKIRTCNSNILYYMNSVSLVAPKAAKGFENAVKVMQLFDDIPATTQMWRSRFPNACSIDSAGYASLMERYIAAAMSWCTGNAGRLRCLSHSKSNYRRDVHTAQFTPCPGTWRAYPICAWGNDSFAIVNGIASQGSGDCFGNQDILSFWLKEDAEWRLLSMTSDPVNTNTSALKLLGQWAEEHLAAFPEGHHFEQVASTPKYSSKGTVNDRFGAWCWIPAKITTPFVQVAEFHYGRSSRLFFLSSDDSDSIVSEGRLWTTYRKWTVRVWTLSKGSLTIGVGVDFDH
eukprot:TRINITY_DN28693_c0_g1_i1.p1 TRINITY_DN28693_c0_g1~~TRINITY_DN28693_c0_g1_i1.p1  ORF type:complete len:421 (-),score=64.37 TRINITY_DN28693_c0_g1_i1:293-1555(-)